MHSVYQEKKNCLNRGCTESFGNDDVLALNNAKSPQVRNGEDDVKQERIAWVEFVVFNVQSYRDTLIALRVCSGTFC